MARRGHQLDGAGAVTPQELAGVAGIFARRMGAALAHDVGARNAAMAELAREGIRLHKTVPGAAARDEHHPWFGREVSLKGAVATTPGDPREARRVATDRQATTEDDEGCLQGSRP